MTQTLSTTLVNQLASFIAQTFSDGYLELYSGAMGSTPEDVSLGVLEANLKLPMAAFGAPVNGVLTLAGQWFGACVGSASATLTWGRFCDHLRTTFLLVTVSGPTGPGQIKLDNPAITLGQVIEITSFTYTVPNGS